MALGSVIAAPLFSQAWVEKYAPVTERAMVAEVAVYTVASDVYDIDTDTWDTETTTYILGKARIQPVRSSLQNAVPGNETTIQNVLVSVPISTNDIDLVRGYQMTVLSAPLNPQLLRYLFVVDSFIDSSNPLERTFYCTVDEEDVS